MSVSDIITVARDQEHLLGKKYTVKDGHPEKQSEVRVSLAIARQYPVKDVEALEQILKEVSEDSHAAIINGSFPQVEIGQEFLVMSEKAFRTKGINRDDARIRWPVEIQYGGRTYPAVGRFKEHIHASSWILLDRDIDEHTPSEFANLSYEEWLDQVEEVIPGLRKANRLHAHSASARVIINGNTVSQGNGHTWVQVSADTDIQELRDVVKQRAIALGFTWKKPRFSRQTGEIVAYGIASIIDWSVLVPGRLVFVGKPEIENA